jgi:REP element-mobilizing transposase RayT
MLQVRKRGRLPHWDADAPYFVTFNLADAMPAEFRERLRVERRVRIAELERLKERATPAELHAIDEIIRERAEGCLDQGAGSCWMRDARVADLVANTLMHFDELRYLLFAWTVMPNHVHANLDAYERIDRILHSWKSFSAKEANRFLGRKGEFWQDDYYDRTIRNPEEFDRTVRYVLENPAKAGLSNWRWVRVYSDRFESPGETPGDCGRDARSPLRNRN